MESNRCSGLDPSTNRLVYANSVQPNYLSTRVSLSSIALNSRAIGFVGTQVDPSTRRQSKPSERALNRRLAVYRVAGNSDVRSVPSNSGNSNRDSSKLNMSNQLMRLLARKSDCDDNQDAKNQTRYDEVAARNEAPEHKGIGASRPWHEEEPQITKGNQEQKKQQ